MAITRKFLGLQGPALQGAVEYLVAEYAQQSLLDLRRTIVVVPGRRAARRLLEVLVERSESRGLRLRPPRIATVGRLPEHLYEPQRPFANDLVQRLAWVSVLRSMPPDRLAPLVPHPPAGDDTARWLELADLLRRQHVELAADRMDFAMVAGRVRELGGAREELRWRAMASLQRAYHALLDRHELWDRQTARLVAIERRECQTDSDIVLLGTVDMNITMRAMLDQVKSRVTVLVVAAAEGAARFDEYGCLLPHVWSEQGIEVSGEQLEFVDGPRHQAEAVLREIDRYDGRYQADEITIGVPDEQLIPFLEREMSRYDLPVRWGPGRPLIEAGPLRLLKALGRCLQFNRFQDWATLVRQPDLEAWINQFDPPPDWICMLDRYHERHLPYLWPTDWLGDTQTVQALQAALTPLEALVEPLRSPARPLAGWHDPLMKFLLQVYQQRELDRSSAADRPVIVACERLQDVFQEQTAVPAELSPVVTATEAIELLLDELAKETVPQQVEDAVELLGWLELTLDDAPALIVTSLNEGFVPESVNSDLFLPDSIRSQLGLFDNKRRYARDAYALSVLCAVRESVHLISARSNRDGDPLSPSRLLFATDDREAAQRALGFFRREGAPVSAAPRGSSVSSSALSTPPRPGPLPKRLRSCSVTGFRNYLACPYRFYLRHVLKLAASHDRAEELDAASFGSLAHEVLRAFGQSPQRDSTDPLEIRAALNRELTHYAAGVFGQQTTPAVRIQIEQLRVRLAAFAERQAEWCAQGWQIEHIEVPQAQHHDATLGVDGESIVLTGRIDRIDIHRETGRRAILDYKTSDTAKQPDQAHRRSGEWIDLQLPLYRHLARSLELSEPLELGYVLLPKDTSKIGFALASWTGDELAEADERARQVVRDLWAERFWPPADTVGLSPEYAAICREGVR